jgi:hypothetical protein
MSGGLMRTFNSVLNLHTRDIRNKLIEKELVITKADKGKTIVILTANEYIHKVKNFIQENQFTSLNSDPT